MFSQKRALHESEGHDADGDTVQNEGADGTAQDVAFLADEAGAGQVGDGAGHPQQAVVAAGRQGQTVVGQPQHLLGAGRQPADLPHLPGCQLGVAVDALIAQFGKPPGLDGPGGQDLLAQLGAGFDRAGAVQLAEGDGVHLDAQVDAVE